MSRDRSRPGSSPLGKEGPVLRAREALPRCDLSGRPCPGLRGPGLQQRWSGWSLLVKSSPACPGDRTRHRGRSQWSGSAPSRGARGARVPACPGRPSPPPSFPPGRGSLGWAAESMAGRGLWPRGCRSSGPRVSHAADLVVLGVRLVPGACFSGVVPGASGIVCLAHSGPECREPVSPDVSCLRLPGAGSS